MIQMEGDRKDPVIQPDKPIAGQEHGQTVAKHYNELKEAGRDNRLESRIFHMRNFNNWIKSVLIGNTLQKLKKEKDPREDIKVLDLCSGKGGDLLKWKKGQIQHLVCADIAGTSVEQSENRYQEMLDREHNKRNVFSAEFIEADCSKKILSYKDPGTKFDICSCQFSFHYCFESFDQVETMLQNAVGNLHLGGYFIGTTPNSHDLVRRWRQSEGNSFGNEVYSVTFDQTDKDDIPLFGAKYNFHLEGVVDCPEFLVYFPVLEKMAKKLGMKLISKLPFADFFDKHSNSRDYSFLLSRMQALEAYPSEPGTSLMSGVGSEYEDARACVERLKQEDGDRERGGPRTVGTLSKSEWEAITLYCVFVFQKVFDPVTGEKWISTEPSESSPLKRSHPDTQEDHQVKKMKSSD